MFSLFRWGSTYPLPTIVADVLGHTRACHGRNQGRRHEVLLQQKRIVLSRQAVKQRRQRLHTLTVKRDVDEVAIFELSKARGRLFEAESELIQQVVQLKIAQVRLRKAKGLLAKECGFEPTLCLEGCCHGACCRGTSCR
jgi:hypothetical protein